MEELKGFIEAYYLRQANVKRFSLKNDRIKCRFTKSYPKRCDRCTSTYVTWTIC